MGTNKIMTRGTAPTGIVQAVRGAVVDVEFAQGGLLPQINSALVVEWDLPAPLVLEVHSHLDQTTLRAVAFGSTTGLSRGVVVRDTGGLVTVPVGAAVGCCGRGQGQWHPIACRYAAPVHSCGPAALDRTNRHGGGV